MKKLLLILTVGILAMPVQAKEIMVPRIYADVDVACSRILNTGGTPTQLVGCIARETTNPLYFEPGWTQYIKHDMKLKLLGDAVQKENFQSLTGYEEKQAITPFMTANKKMWGDTLNYLNQYPQMHKFMDAATVKQKFGY